MEVKGELLVQGKTIVNADVDINGNGLVTGTLDVTDDITAGGRARFNGDILESNSNAQGNWIRIGTNTWAGTVPNSGAIQVSGGDYYFGHGTDEQAFIDTKASALYFRVGGNNTDALGRITTAGLFIFEGQQINSSNTQDSTTLGEGAIVTLGGASFAKNVNIGGDTVISGNLTVTGNTFATEVETVLVNDNNLYLNNGYTTVSAQAGGLTVNFLPTVTADTVAIGGFTAGIVSTSNPNVITTGSATFAVGDIIQIDSANTQSNNGLFEVLLHTGTTLEIRGIGITGTSENFTQNQFVTDTTVAGGITKVNVSVMESGTDGYWQLGFGSTTGITFQKLATREDTPIDTGIAYWDSATSKFLTNIDLTWDGSIFNVSGKSTLQENLEVYGTSQGETSGLFRQTHDATAGTGAQNSWSQDLIGFTFNSISDATTYYHKLAEVSGGGSGSGSIQIKGLLAGVALSRNVIDIYIWARGGLSVTGIIYGENNYTKGDIVIYSVGDDFNVYLKTNGTFSENNLDIKVNGGTGGQTKIDLVAKTSSTPSGTLSFTLSTDFTGTVH